MSHITEIHPKDLEKIQKVLGRAAKKAGGLTKLADQLGIALSNLYNVSSGSRPPWPKLLAELGYKPIIRYVRITK